MVDALVPGLEAPAKVLPKWVLRPVSAEGSGSLKGSIRVAAACVVCQCDTLDSSFSHCEKLPLSSSWGWP